MRLKNLILTIILMCFLPVYINAVVTDNTTNLIIPSGESYTKSGVWEYLGNVTVDGTLYVAPYDGSTGSGIINITAQTIEISGVISAIGKGYTYNNPSVPGSLNGGDAYNGGTYMGGAGGGGYYNSALTLDAEQGGCGGGFGGRGGKGAGAPITKVGIKGFYNSPENAIHLGRHGGDYWQTPASHRGGKGGGNIILKCNYFELKSTGLITADAIVDSGDKYYEGGGSGGAIYIESKEMLKILDGGKISCNGSDGEQGYGSTGEGLGGGGGGSGGLIILKSYSNIYIDCTAVGGGFVSVEGGKGGPGANINSCGGGGGGGGVIQILYRDDAYNYITGFYDTDRFIVKGGVGGYGSYAYGEDGEAGIKEMIKLPYISSLIPPYGAAGKTYVTINGTGFGDTRGKSYVVFNETVIVSNDSEFDLWSSTKIKVKVPYNASTGTIQVISCVTTTLTNTYYLDSNKKDFTIYPCVIFQVSPSSADYGGIITISGAGFGDLQETSTVTFNGTNAGVAELWSDNQIKIKVPSNISNGPAVIKIVKDGEPSNGVNFTVGVPPTIISIFPDKGDVGELVTILGTKFGDSQGTSKVYFNSTDAGIAKSWSDTKIEVYVPESATSGPLKVVKYGLESNTTNFIVGAKPKIISISPAVAPNIGIVSINQITGDNFEKGATVKLIKTGYPDIIATDVEVNSISSISCKFNLQDKSAGNYTVVVINPNSMDGRLEDGFKVIEVSSDEKVLISNNRIMSGSNEVITIVYKFEAGDKVEIKIYDVYGDVVKEYETEASSTGSVSWDGRNDKGEEVGSGVYLIQIKSGSETINKKVMIIR